MTLRWRISSPTRLIDAVKNQVDSLYSARFIKRALEANVCRVNGRIERFGSALLRKGDEIELNNDWEQFEASRPSDLSIIYEDDELFVINKPVQSICTDEAFRRKLKKSLWLAHRLDKDTTGVLLFGKSAQIADELQQVFENRQVHKEYLALVDREMNRDSGVIENYLVKKGAFQGQTIWGSSRSDQGLYAKTSWLCFAKASSSSLLQCQIATGRTHQIRTHLSEIGHPIIVDRQYASKYESSIRASRPLLHAFQLSLEWRRKVLEFKAPLATDFQEVLKKAHFSSYERFTQAN